jgi:phosphomannomutase
MKWQLFLTKAIHMLRYIFDVDGTITPSRCAIDPKFLRFMLKFCKENYVYFVTGSDAPKTIEQVGDMLFNSVTRSYNCNGNSVWEKGINIRNNPWKLPDLARTFLISCKYESDFSIRTGNHIEERPGMVNFSVVGRNADAEQRAAYVDFEAWNGERRKIADDFNTTFPDLQATIGGDTGIDIAPTGSDKSQILKDFTKSDTIIFFGDAIFDGGNDYTLAQAIKKKGVGRAHKVSGWEETYKILTDVYS